MFDAPKTKEEARKRMYGKWAWDPQGTTYKESRCAYEVNHKAFVYYQCSRKPGHGPDALYCKQHAKKVGGGE